MKKIEGCFIFILQEESLHLDVRQTCLKEMEDPGEETASNRGTTVFLRRIVSPS